MSNILTLRIISSPYGDFTKGSVLSQAELDNDLITLKGMGLLTATTLNNFVTLTQLNGDTITFTVPSGSTGGDTYWISGSAGNYSLKRINDSGLDATGQYSLAEGYGTTAGGFASHAQGNQTVASGEYSHSEGYLSQANNSSTHAEGSDTRAEGFASHSEGVNTWAIGAVSHAEGTYTTANTWSHSEGSGTLADGEASHAEGYLTQALGYYSHSEGWDTLASGITSHAEGSGTTASGIASHAEGDTTVASGDNSHAEGFFSRATGDTSHAEGWDTKAYGSYSHSEGESTIASGNFGSHAEGLLTVASGDFGSHAEGQETDATGIRGSHAEGYRALASGSFGSHAEGSGTTASGQASHAEGQGTIASGRSSHAGGITSVAGGIASFVHGSGSTAQGNNTIVFGNGIIGIAPDTTYVDSLNIRTVLSGSPIKTLGVDVTGKVVIAPDVYVSGFTFDNGNYNISLTRNDGVTLTQNLGILSSDMNVTGGTYNINTGVVTFTNNSGGTFNVSGFVSGYTDTYVSGGTFDIGTGIATFTNTSGGTFDVNGFSTAVAQGLDDVLTVSPDAYQYAKFIADANKYTTIDATDRSIKFYDETISLSEIGKLTYNSLTFVTPTLYTSHSPFSLQFVNLSNSSLFYTDSDHMRFQSPSSGVMDIRWDNLLVPASLSTLQLPSLISGSTRTIPVSVNGAFADISGNIVTNDVTISGGSFNNANGTTTLNNSTGGTITITGYTSELFKTLAGTSPTGTTGIIYRGNGIQVTGNTAAGAGFSSSVNSVDPTLSTGGAGIGHILTGGQPVSYVQLFSQNVNGTSGPNNIIGMFSGATTTQQAMTFSAVKNNSFQPFNDANRNLFVFQDGYINPPTRIVEFGTDYIKFNKLTGGTGNYLTTDTTGKLVFSAVTSGGSSTFTGGTVTGPTNFIAGLSANTISATTYLNLPTDIRVTGGTFSGSASTIVFTNNTGGTFNVTGISVSSTFTGGTVSGATNFTNGLTANTFSATTYLNLPVTNFTGGTVTGATNFTNGLTANTFSATTLFGNSTEKIVVGQNVVAGDLLFLSGDSKYWKANYSAINTSSTELRVAMATILADATGDGLVQGSYVTAGLTPGLYYVGINGGIVSSVPATEGLIQRTVGTAKSSTIFNFNPDYSFYEITII